MEHHHAKKLNWAFLAVSFTGLMDALYLSIERLRGQAVLCNIIQGCDKVTSSTYSTLLHIPVAYLGFLYYFLIFLLALWFLATNNHTSLTLAASMTVIGLLASTWFVYLQLFVIKAICLYCFLSAITSTLLFAFGIYYLVKKLKKVGLPK